MITILFDFISLQDYHNGGEEYVRKVLADLSARDGVKIVGVYDSCLKFLGDDYAAFSARYVLSDIQSKTLSEIVETYNVDTFFIGIAQRYINYDLSGIRCRVVCTVHDIGNIEIAENRIHFLYRHSWKDFVKIGIDYFWKNGRYATANRIMGLYDGLRTFWMNDNVSLITVSSYTKNSLFYFFPELSGKEIKVLYPPVKNYSCTPEVEDVLLKRFFQERKRFLLFLSAGRANKNFDILRKSFVKIRHAFPDMHLVVTGLRKDIKEDNVVCLNYVSNSDVEHLYKQAWALVYPSLAEGFGYPPVEAIKYSTPVLASNVCSMPEVLGNSAVYFSPFYENDLFCKMKYLDANYHHYRLKSRERYDAVSKRQEQDFRLLIAEILK